MQPGMAVSFLAWLEKFVYKRADHVLVVTKGARENLIGKGVSPDRVTVMPHWIDEELFRSAGEEERNRVRREHGWEDRFVVLFAGNIGIVQGLESVVRAAEILGPESKVKMVLVGNGVDKARLEALVQELGLQDRVQFIGHQPIEKIPAFTAAADALLVQLKKSEVMELVIPTKTVAYLAAGRPILAAVDGAAAELVRESGAGVYVEPENAEALAQIAKEFAAKTVAELASMGENGRRYLVDNLAKQKVIRLYEEILQRVIAQRERWREKDSSRV
jgi:colanic acid biosynthesis glycosyl transferase WcaI